MLRRWSVAFALVVIVVFAWAACVGSDPELEVQRGAQFQPCFENGTCLSTLVCQGGTCDVDRDGGGSTTSSSSSGGGSSSSTSSSGSSGSLKPDDCGTLSSSPVTACFSATEDLPCTAGAPDCCPGKGCQAKGGTCANAGVWECFTKQQCSKAAAGGACCVKGTTPDAKMTCGDPYKLAFTSPATCKSACAGGEVTLCQSPTDCGSGFNCVGTTLELTGADGALYKKIVTACIAKAVVVTDAGTEGGADASP